MGTGTTFDAGFDLTAGVLNFDMYLTMGYGFSAKKPNRLLPKYYNPEFNRKAAWKVVVTPPQGEDPPDMSNTWNDANNTAEWPVTVEVYDWQVGATVFTGAPEEFGDADPDNIFASSGIGSVSVEIPGMNSSLQSVTAPDSGTGFPPDPCIYTIPIANQNSLAEGEYIGLVKVTDERAVLTPADGRDFLIDTPNGVELIHYAMPEYATYQTFIATVVIGNLMPIADAVATTPTSVFEGASVTFDASTSSDPDGTIDAYEWDFDEDGIFGEDPDDAFTGDAWNPTHNFAYGDGFIDVQLRVTDNLGGTDELDTPITITITQSKNIVLRAGVNISDLCTAKNTDEVYVLFEDNQVWRYANGLTGGALHHTMPVIGTPLGRKIESTWNGDTINGYWTTSRYNSHSNLYSGTPSASHNNAWAPFENSYVLALYGGYTGYQADIKTVFVNTNNIWLDRYAPPSYPPASGTFWTNADGPLHVNKYYLKGVHSLNNIQQLAWIEDDPEWRLEITNYGSSGYYTAGGTQTDADGGFNTPIDITVDSSDDIFILDILSTGDRRIKKFTSTATSVGSFGDNTSMSEDPSCLDASLSSGWIYVGLDDMVSVFFPSEQP